MDSTQTQSHHHILPLSVYINVGLALLGLTVITVWISFYNFGSFNLVVAMGVAAVKASLVALYFMHLKYDNKLYLVIFLASLLFLATFIILTMFDTLRRGDLDEIKSAPINKDAVIYRTESAPAIVDSLKGTNDSLNQTLDTVVIGK